MLFNIGTAKTGLMTVAGIVGGAVASALGGWSSAMTTLFIFMVIDYITGLIVAGVFHRSTKTDKGTLESRAGFKGICKKFVMLLFVVIGYRLDLIMGTTVVKDGVTIAFIVNEGLSIIENAGLMGIPMPDVVTKAIEVLKEEKK